MSETPLFDDAVQLESIVVPAEEVPLGAVQQALTDPEEFTDAVFMAKSQRLQLYRQPLYMRQVVRGEVISVQKQRDPFQFVDGRFPSAGDRITHAIAAELRRHQLFNNRFIEYQPKAIPVREGERYAVENERLRMQIAAMAERQNEMARELERAYTVRPGAAPVAVETGGDSVQPSPSLGKAIADQAALPSSQSAGATVALPPEVLPPEVPHAPPGTADGTILDQKTGLPEESAIPQTPPTEIPKITTKLDAVAALTGEPLNLPVDDMGSYPTKKDIIAFARRHNVTFPGYD